MFRLLAIVSLALGSLTGCSAGASLVRSDEHGGVVALRGPYMPAMAEARLLMVSHCNGRVLVVERGDRAEFRCVASRPEGPLAQRDARSEL